MLPEIILLAKAEDAVSRNANLLIPDIERLIVLEIDRRIQAIRIQPDHVGQELP